MNRKKKEEKKKELDRAIINHFIIIIIYALFTLVHVFSRVFFFFINESHIKKGIDPDTPPPPLLQFP